MTRFYLKLPAIISSNYKKKFLTFEFKTPLLHLGVVAIEKGAFGSPKTMVTNFT